MKTLRELMDTLPQIGVVEWIGVRPARLEDMRIVAEATVRAGRGLDGDRYSKRDGKRQVTLMQAEHLQAMASMLGVSAVEPVTLRRNIVVRSINLLALKDKRFRVGDAVLEFSGLCQPCSGMETSLGPGGYNVMRGHGGITAIVVQGGIIRVGSSVAALPIPVGSATESRAPGQPSALS